MQSTFSLGFSVVVFQKTRQVLVLRVLRLNGSIRLVLSYRGRTVFLFNFWKCIFVLDPSRTCENGLQNTLPKVSKKTEAGDLLSYTFATGKNTQFAKKKNILKKMKTYLKNSRQQWSYSTSREVPGSKTGIFPPFTSRSKSYFPPLTSQRKNYLSPSTSHLKNYLPPFTSRSKLHFPPFTSRYKNCLPPFTSRSNLYFPPHYWWNQNIRLMEWGIGNKQQYREWGINTCIENRDTCRTEFCEFDFASFTDDFASFTDESLHQI